MIDKFIELKTLRHNTHERTYYPKPTNEKRNVENVRGGLS